MQLPYHQQRLLRRIDRTLRRSDPQLAAMLAIFAQLYVGDAPTSPEQRTPVRRAAWPFAAVAWLAIILLACAAALSRAAGGLTRGRLGAAQHSRARIG